MRRALRQDHLLADSCSAFIDDELLVTVDVPRLDDTCAGFPVGIDQTTRIRLLFPRMCREHRSWKNGFIRKRGTKQKWFVWYTQSGQKQALEMLISKEWDILSTALTNAPSPD